MSFLDELGEIASLGSDFDQSGTQDAQEPFGGGRGAAGGLFPGGGESALQGILGGIPNLGFLAPSGAGDQGETAFQDPGARVRGTLKDFRKAIIGDNLAPNAFRLSSGRLVTRGRDGVFRPFSRVQVDAPVDEGASVEDLERIGSGSIIRSASPTELSAEEALEAQAQFEDREQRFAALDPSTPKGARTLEAVGTAAKKGGDVQALMSALSAAQAETKEERAERLRGEDIERRETERADAITREREREERQREFQLRLIREREESARRLNEGSKGKVSRAEIDKTTARMIRQGQAVMREADKLEREANDDVAKNAISKKELPIKLEAIRKMRERGQELADTAKLRRKFTLANPDAGITPHDIEFGEDDMFGGLSADQKAARERAEREQGTLDAADKITADLERPAREAGALLEQANPGLDADEFRDTIVRAFIGRNREETRTRILEAARDIKSKGIEGSAGLISLNIPFQNLLEQRSQQLGEASAIGSDPGQQDAREQFSRLLTDAASKLTEGRFKDFLEAPGRPRAARTTGQDIARESVEATQRQAEAFAGAVASPFRSLLGAPQKIAESLSQRAGDAARKRGLTFSEIPGTSPRKKVEIDFGDTPPFEGAERGNRGDPNNQDDLEFMQRREQESLPQAVERAVQQLGDEGTFEIPSVVQGVPLNREEFFAFMKAVEQAGEGVFAQGEVPGEPVELPEELTPEQRAEVDRLVKILTQSAAPREPGSIQERFLQGLNRGRRGGTRRSGVLSDVPIEDPAERLSGPEDENELIRRDINSDSPNAVIRALLRFEALNPDFARSVRGLTQREREQRLRDLLNRGR
jgi:hypothetical protein